MSFDCKSCNKKFSIESSLIKHLSCVHKIRPPQYVVEYKLNGVIPLCACGCKQPVKYAAGKSVFREYCKGHVARVSNNYVTSGGVQRSAITRKKQAAEGLLKGKDSSETKKKKSESHLGEKNAMFGKEHKSSTKLLIGKINKEKWGCVGVKEKFSKDKIAFYKTEEGQIAKEGLRNGLFERMKHKSFYSSNTEKKFESFLIELEIPYVKQFRIKNKIYDFQIKNGILFEVDGDFWHCNPVKYPLGPSYSSQQRNVLNDIYKNELAKESNFSLYRFWQSEIDKESDKVKSKLLELYNASS